MNLVREGKQNTKKKNKIATRLDRCVWGGGGGGGGGGYLCSVAVWGSTGVACFICINKDVYT